MAPRASRGAGFSSHHQPYRAARLALCLAASFVLLGVARWTHWRGAFVSAETALAAPLLRTWSGLAHEGRDWTQALEPHTRLAAHVRTLERRLLLLRVRLAADRALIARNIRLRRLLGLRQRLGRRTLVVPILTLPHDPYPPRMLLARGRTSGLRRGFPVVDPHGLLGVLSVVRPHSALVRLLVTRRSLTPVEDLRSHVLTFAEGTGRLERLELPFVPNGTDIRRGDLLVTSGVGGTYPSGYPVAVVTRVTPAPAYTFARIRARPLAQPLRDRDALVLLPRAAARRAHPAAPRPRTPGSGPR